MANGNLIPKKHVVCVEGLLGWLTTSGKGQKSGLKSDFFVNATFYFVKVGSVLFDLSSGCFFRYTYKLINFLHVY